MTQVTHSELDVKLDTTAQLATDRVQNLSVAYDTHYETSRACALH